MCEIKRLIINKRYIILIMALFVANIALFQYSQMDIRSIMNTEEYYWFVDGWEANQTAKHEEFYATIDNISKEKDKMLSVSIFADEDSFAYKNIIKTEKDFKKISNVRLSEVNDYAVDALLEYDAVYIFGFVVMLFTVITFLDERKKGLWQIVYVCKGGRAKLALKRLAVLFIVALMTETVLVTSTLAVSFLNFGGTDILSVAVQSVTKLQNFTLPISVMTFFVYYIIFLSAALAVTGLFVWFMLSVIHNGNIGIIICFFIYGVEFFLNIFISSRNSLCILKYTNLWCLLNPGKAFSEYNNFMFFGFVINVREYLSVLLAVLVVLLSLCIIISNIKTKPFYSPGILETYACNLLDRMRKVLCHLNGIGYELFKMFVQRKGIVVLAVLIYVFVSNIDDSRFFLNPERIMLDKFYESYTCELNEESLNAYREIEYDVKNVDYDNNNRGKTRTKMFELLEEQKIYAESLEERGIEGWFINDRGYAMLFGEKKSVKRMIDGVFSLMAIVLIVAPIYVSENQSGVTKLISATKRGRGVIFRRKMLYCLGCTLVIATVMLAGQLYEVMFRYKLKGLNAPVQNVELLGNVPFDISIGGFIVIWFMARIFIMIMSACIVMLISVRGTSQNKVYLCAALVIPLGLLNGLSRYISGVGIIFKTIIPIVFCMVVSVVCCISTYKKWTNR